MTRRERSLLVLSPRARSRDELKDYKPFGGKSLLEILRDVAVGVSQCKLREFDEHTIHGCFFGASMESLRDAAVSLVDSEIFRSDETAAEMARTALAHFTGSVILAGDVACPDAALQSRLARSDDALFAYLFIDLCGPWFSRIGEQLARLWGG